MGEDLEKPTGFIEPASQEINAHWGVRFAPKFSSVRTEGSKESSSSRWQREQQGRLLLIECWLSTQCSAFFISFHLHNTPVRRVPVPLPLYR